MWNEQYSNTLGSAVSVKDRRAWWGAEGLTTRQGMMGRRQLENTNKVDYSISGSAAPSAVDSFSELKVTSQSRQVLATLHTSFRSHSYRPLLYSSSPANVICVSADADPLLTLSIPPLITSSSSYNLTATEPGRPYQ